MGVRNESPDFAVSVSGLTDKQKLDICTTVAGGRGAAYALTVVGASFDDLRAELDDDQQFAENYDMALRLRDEEIEHALHERAKSGNIPAIKFWLANRRGDEWSEDKTVRHVGAAGGPIEIAQTTVIALRELLTQDDMRDQAIEWIEAEALPAGDESSGEDQVPGEAG